MNGIHALSGAYAIDALDEEERAAFEEHLAVCSDCRAEVTGLREAAARLPALSATNPPPELADRVLAGVRRTRPLPPATRRHAARGRWRGFRVAAVAAAAAVIVGIGAGVAVVQPWADDEKPAQVAMTDQVMHADDAQEVTMRMDDGSSAEVIRSKSVGRAVIITEGMAPAPEGMVHQVWLQTSAGEMVPAGLMSAEPDQMMLLKGDATDAVGVGITVEPAGGSAEPTSEPIVLLDLQQAE